MPGMARPCTTGAAPAAAVDGATMDGTTTVRVVADRPAAERTCQSVSRPKRTGTDQVVSSAARVRATTAQSADPAGAAHTLTRSPGTAVPVSVRGGFPRVRRGPVARGAENRGTQ